MGTRIHDTTRRDLGDRLDLAAQWAVTSAVVLLVAALAILAAIGLVVLLGHALQEVWPR